MSGGDARGRCERENRATPRGWDKKKEQLKKLPLLLLSNYLVVICLI